MKVLFSCVGTTDPIRGMHDGAMLHIMRHYRPDAVVMYVSPEMKAHDAKDNRYALAFESIQQRYPDYHPEIHRIDGDAVDVSEFDSFYEPFQKIVKDWSAQYPDAEILLNLSSGSTQMKMTMALLAMDLRYRTKGIQVKNFEQRSGTSERSSEDNYDIHAEIELNEDDDDASPNRCSEPDLFLIRRNEERQRVKAMLDQYDYKALEAMRDAIPADCRKLVRHLAHRSDYDFAQAEELAENLPVPFCLFPMRPCKSWATKRAYREESEYLLCLELMQKTGALTNFVLRLNPLVLRLQQAYLKQICSFDCGQITIRKGSHVLISRDKIRALHPALETYLDQHFNIFRDNTDISIVFCNALLAYLGKADTEEGRLFTALEKLNQSQRNAAAHTLNNTTEQDIYDLIGFGSKKLVEKLEALIQEIYADLCDPKLFRIYDTCNEYIYQRL